MTAQHSSVARDLPPALTPGAGKYRDKCLGEGKGENAPRLLALGPS